MPRRHNRRPTMYEGGRVLTDADYPPPPPVGLGAPRPAYATVTPLPLTRVAELVEHRATFKARARSKGASRLALSFEGLHAADVAGLAAAFPVGAAVLAGSDAVVYNHTAAGLLLAEVLDLLSPGKRGELEVALARLDAINAERARPGRRRRVAST